MRPASRETVASRIHVCPDGFVIIYRAPMSNSRRLFFALSLPDALQQQVIRWRAEAFAPEAGRAVAAANLHLTLAFLGEVTAQKELALRKLAGRIVQPGFSMRLDDLGHWPRPAWSGSAPAARRAGCCSWPSCCVRRPPATAATKARCRSIRISRCCAPPPSRWPSRRRRRAGRSAPTPFPYMSRCSKTAAPAINTSNSGRWPSRHPHDFLSTAAFRHADQTLQTLSGGRDHPGRGNLLRCTAPIPAP